MKKSRLLGAVCAVVFSFITLPSHAALTGVLPATPGGTDWQAVYDTDRDISWVANANLAASNTFGLLYDTDLGSHPNDDPYGTLTNTILTDGRMSWGAALHWIDAMNAANYLGFSDWDLPFTHLPDATCSKEPVEVEGYGYNCTASDMGHLYNVEGVTPASPGLFSNVQSSDYWSHTDPISWVWLFDFARGGFQYDFNKRDLGGHLPGRAWAVHAGNIGAVPIPAAVWLFGSGLLGLIGIARKKTV